MTKLNAVHYGIFTTTRSPPLMVRISTPEVVTILGKNKILTVHPGKLTAGYTKWWFKKGVSF